MAESRVRLGSWIQRLFSVMGDICATGDGHLAEGDQGCHELGRGGQGAGSTKPTSGRTRSRQEVAMRLNSSRQHSRSHALYSTYTSRMWREAANPGMLPAGGRTWLYFRDTAVSPCLLAASAIVLQGPFHK